MTREELKEFALKNKDNFSMQLKRHHYDVFELINNQYDFKNFGEKLFVYINGESSIGKCKICDKKTKFDGYWKGYIRIYCSCKCKSKDKSNLSHETRKCIVCGNEFQTKKSKTKKICSNACRMKHNSSYEINKTRTQSIKKSMMEKYGVEWGSQLSTFKEKFKQTKLERYGNENYVNPNKAKQTKSEKYGDENYNNIEKNRQTKLERYNDVNYNNRDKFKSTMIDKFGVEWAMQSDELKEKSKHSFMEKYGGIGLGSDELKEKIKLTMMENYGVDNPLKNDDIKEKQKQTCIEKYGGYTLSSPTLREKVKDTLLLKYNVENVSQINDVKDKVREYYKDEMVKDIFFGDRLQNKVIPLFKSDDYINSNYTNRYLFECNICHFNFSDHLYSGHIPRCPFCYPPSISKPQMEIFEYIKSLLPTNTDILQNVRHPIHPLELDIYIPSLKLAIEYNGLYWHGEINGGKDKNYHLNKTKECEKNNIHLIHIFEDEWFDKQNIIKSKLKYLLKCNKEKIYARNCDIKLVDYVDCNLFLNKYHLQGADKSSIRIGLFYNNELVSVMTFGGNRIALGSNKINNEYEMYRFCIGDKSVVGAGGKLFNYFIRNYNPLKITSYADKRYSFISSVYSKIGFNLIGDTVPNYWYFDKIGIRVHRFNFRKDQLHKKLQSFDPSLTEWENMQLNGYDRIWDCGNLKYVWKNPNSLVK